MPFADYDDFDACTRANSDKQDPAAYCAAIKRRAEGECSADAVITGVSDEPVTADELDQLTEEVAEWQAETGAHDEALWLNEEADVIVYDDRDGDDITQEADADTEERHVVGPAMDGMKYRLEEGEVYCEPEGEVVEATAGDACPACGETVPTDTDEGLSQEQAEGFAVDVFRILQAEDSDMDLDGDLMGVGVDFPNAGVYVDWRIEAWPDDEQLAEPHVSDYGTIEDLEQATGGVVEHVETIATATDADVSAVAQEAAAIAADDRDQDAVVISGLSQEAQEAVERSYNVTVRSLSQEGEYDGYTLGTDGDPGPADAYHDFLDALVDAGADVWQVRSGELHVWPRDDGFPLHDPHVKVVGIEEPELQAILDDHDVDFMHVNDGI